jgi:hypothetical protein
MMAESYVDFDKYDQPIQTFPLQILSKQISRQNTLTVT